jgi:inner membrane protein
MDPLTHSALGAVVAGLIAGDRDDLRAPALGAMAGALPDIDIIPTLFLGPLSQLDLHRGITHSILFALIISLLAGYILGRLPGNRNGNKRFISWAVILLCAILSHIILDCFTSYGTRIFLPFSSYRVAWGTIAIADPFFSIPLVIAALSLFLVRRSKKLKNTLFIAGFSISLVYLAATAVNKQYIYSIFENSLNRQDIVHSRLMTTPMPFSNLLWVGIAEGKDYFYTGYYSILDRDDSISFEKDKKNHDYIKNLSGYDPVKKLISFAKDFYSIDSRQGALVFNDLRYGSLAAAGGQKQFVFSYIIKNKPGNPEIISRVHSRITPEKFIFLLKRIAGKH